MKSEVEHICISRTDSIGDVVLTLPLAGYLKQKYPEAKITFLCKGYTEPIVSCSKDIDEVWITDELEELEEEDIVKAIQSKNFSQFIHVFPRSCWAKWVKKAGVPDRIGTSHRMYHMLTCNHRVNFTRKKSDLHESQLNFKLLLPFGEDHIPSLNQMPEYLNIEIPETDDRWTKEHTGKKVILHALSQGSAVEWGMNHYFELANALTEKGYTVFFTGTESEGEILRKHLPENPSIIDLTGKMDLKELLAFISKCDAMVAASTGPLHLAGIVNLTTIGLFSPLRPIHPGRWQPLGQKVHIVTGKPACNTCKVPTDCTCMKEIEAEEIERIILEE